MTSDKLKYQAELALAVYYDFSEILGEIKIHALNMHNNNCNKNELDEIFKQLKCAEALLAQLHSFAIKQ